MVCISLWASIPMVTIEMVRGRQKKKKPNRVHFFSRKIEKQTGGAGSWSLVLHHEPSLILDK